MENTKEFYDIRGAKAIKSGQLPQVNTTYSSPYDFFYQQLNRWPAEACVLEVGVGTGLHLAEVARQNFICFGVDISEASIKSAKENFKRLNLDKHLTLLQGSFDHKDLKSKKFDLVYTSGALYYLDLSEFLIFLKNQLKDENSEFICVETNGSNWLLNFYRKIKNFIFSHRDQQTLTGLLKPKDLCVFNQNFSNVKVVYFDFLVLLTIFLKEGSKLKKVLIRYIKPIDQFLLNTLGLHFLAFKFVMIADSVKSDL